jgi:nicotinamidase-related amidase
VPILTFGRSDNSSLHLTKKKHMENTQNTALLVMDMQAAILGMLPTAADFVENVEKAIAKARAGAIPVIYVVVGFRTGAPEASPNNKGFAGARERFGQMSPEAFIAIAPAIAPQEGDITVVKRRVSAFTGSDLEVVLRAQGIQHIVLTGIATSGVVLSTTREAADKDYRITILADCCADGDEEVHRVLTTKVFPRQADVIALADWN